MSIIGSISDETAKAGIWGSKQQEQASGMIPYISTEANPVETDAVKTVEGLDNCEYIIMGVRRRSSPVPTFCTDAKDMQARVATMKESPEWAKIFIFKRMLGYRTKVEWEAVEADV